MKYDGIDTKVLLKKREKLIFVLISCFLAEGAGYLLHKHIDKHAGIAALSISLFVTALILSIIYTVADTLPLRLKYIHGRKDIPKEALDIDYWFCIGRAIPVMLGMICHNIKSIWDIIHGGYL